MQQHARFRLAYHRGSPLGGSPAGLGACQADRWTGRPGAKRWAHGSLDGSPLIWFSFLEFAVGLEEVCLGGKHQAELEVDTETESRYNLGAVQEIGRRYSWDKGAGCGPELGKDMGSNGMFERTVQSILGSLCHTTIILSTLADYPETALSHSSVSLSP